MACDNPYADKCNCDTPACPRHGKCCECVEFHKEVKKNLPKCLRYLADTQ